ncbi:AAA family ATPase [Actinoplanes sp. KI2]|uniref:HelD family protein n=1 Tax=Actinoplanes sp. KI2 TaxID=2983315 RepID=UPI0021D577EE|nr:AAA family ATPase [Actinoplanes sp. KI2]MCU7726196.1 AAA family ATPase [Actinoplanes sp. KI2]
MVAVGEQAQVSRMYEVLDAEIASVVDELAGRPGPDRAPVLRARLAALRGAEHALVFGRIDRVDGTTLHLGRRGLWVDGEPILIDWRAPAAEPFYAATAAHPMGLRRRRHLRLDGRRVVSVADEILDGSPPGPDDRVGDGPLAEALAAPRTGRMGDAVATLQAEQDAIVRSAHRGITVVEGGPGTGKTVVALHRAAYVLFALPAAAERGVLVVGPDARFLSYIERVLPSLGENDAVLVTRAGLTGQEPTATDTPAEARRKGQAEMADSIRSLVAARRPAVAPIELPLGSETIEIGAEAVGEAIAAAHDLPHNPGRAAFKEYLIAELRRVRAARTATTLARIDADTAAATGIDLDAAVAADLESLGLGAEARELGRDASTALSELAETVVDDPRLDAAIDRIWPRLTASDIIGPQTDWTAADLALLDEAAELLDGPPEVVYGHIVIDEAQELTEMDWRAVLRRCPSRSMTVVGDFAQAGQGSTVTTWRQAVGDRFERHTLTVNYRTTAEILEYNRDLLAAIAPGQRLSRSLRHGEPPLIAPPTLDLDDDELVAVIGPDHLDIPGAIPVSACRGLEFDTVLVVAPAEFTERDLYVAQTRATRRLVIVPEPDALPTLRR